MVISSEKAQLDYSKWMFSPQVQELIITTITVIIVTIVTSVSFWCMNLIVSTSNLGLGQSS